MFSFLSSLFQDQDPDMRNPYHRLHPQPEQTHKIYEAAGMVKVSLFFYSKIKNTNPENA